ncbi:unnamed protein product [Closterium sp. NIES-54]
MMPSLQAPSPRKRRQCGPETPRKTRSESPAAADSTDDFADLNNAAPRTSNSEDFLRFIQDPASDASVGPAEGAGSANLDNVVPGSGREREGGYPHAEPAMIFCNDWSAYCRTETPRPTSATAQHGAITAAQCGATASVAGPASKRSPRPPRRRETRQHPLTPKARTLSWGMMRAPAAAEADPADESAPPPVCLTSSPVSAASPACSAFPASPKLLVLPDSAFFPSPRISEARFTSPKTSTPAPFEPPLNTASRPPAFRSPPSPRACGTAFEAPQKCGTPSCPLLVEPRLPRARTCDVAADSGGRSPAASACASAIRGKSPASGYSPAAVSPASACATTGAVDRVDQVNSHASTCEWPDAAGTETLDIPPWVREKLSLFRAEEAQKNELAAIACNPRHARGNDRCLSCSKPEPHAGMDSRLGPIDRAAMGDGEKRGRRVECGGECGSECAEIRSRERDADGEKPSLWDIMQWESDMISSVCSTATAKSPRPPFFKSSTFEAPQRSLSKRHRSASALPTTPPPTPSASKASLTIQICDDASANGGDLSFFEELLLEFGAGEGEEAGGEMEEEPGWAEEMCIPAEATAQFEKVAPVVPELDDKWGDYSEKMEDVGKADGGKGLMIDGESIFERIQVIGDEGAEMGDEATGMAEDGVEMTDEGTVADEAEIRTNKLPHDQPPAARKLLSVQLERKQREVGEADAEQQNAPQCGSPFRSGSLSAPASGFAQMWSEAWVDDADAEIPGLAGSCVFRP